MHALSGPEVQWIVARIALFSVDFPGHLSACWRPQLVGHFPGKFMTSGRQQRSIGQLDLERRWLLAQLDAGRQGVNPTRSQALMLRLENLELTLAATPAENMAELLVKLERLADLLQPSPEPQQDCLEAILLSAVLNDTRHLADREVEG